MKRYLLIMALGVVLLSACNTGTEALKENSQPLALANDTTAAVVTDEKSLTQENTAPDQEPPPNAMGRHIKSQGPTNVDWDRKIIKTAEVEMELDNFASYDRTLHSGLRAYGAYIASEEAFYNDYRQGNKVTIKVPVDKFEDLINSFQGEGIKLVQKKISTQDVSGEVIDTRSRMEAKKQTRDQYLALLKQAHNMKDILELRNEINSIQEEIESGAGRVQYLSHQSAYSTVHLNYYQPMGETKKADETPGYARQFKNALHTGGSILWTLLIAAVTIWPLILGVLIAVFLWKKRKQFRTAATGKVS